jgi:hypothetical protein
MNYAASVLIYTFMCLRAITVIFSQNWSTHIFLQQNRQTDPWEYINRSQTHKCGNWDRGCVIPFLGIFVSNFRYCIFAVPFIPFILRHLSYLSAALFKKDISLSCYGRCNRNLRKYEGNYISHTLQPTTAIYLSRAKIIRCWHFSHGNV